MDCYFSIYGMQVPVELRPLYEEVSRTFEQQVYGALKTKGESLDEEVKKITKEFSLSKEQLKNEV